MKIYLGDMFHPDAVEWLNQHAEVVCDFRHIEDLDAILIRAGGVSAEQIEKAKNLKVIGRHGVGFETVNVQAAKEKGVRVLNVPRGNAHSVAEYIVALFLEMSRRLYEGNVRIRRDEFHSIAPASMQGNDITEKAVGMIGMGNISCMAADMLSAAFHTKIYGYDPFVDGEEATRRGFIKLDTIEELIESSDFVSINVHLNESTRNMISGDVFNHFKKNAILVNTARGGIVNEDDLYDALKNGKLAGAACDVFTDEPNYTGNKLFELDNFSATPHLGGNTVDAIRRTSMSLVQGAVAMLEGKDEAEVKNLGCGIIC